MADSNSTEWYWYQVKFDLGIQGNEGFPEDPTEFLRWLLNEQEKYIGDLTVRSARLVLKPG